MCELFLYDDESNCTTNNVTITPQVVTQMPQNTFSIDLDLCHSYPSGNLAILISSVKLGQYYYTIQHDVDKAGLAAAFEPNGYGYCYFPNGDVR